MYKLIATDIDGTLLNNNKELTDETINSIKYAKNKGIKIVLCTGRPFIGIKKFLNQLSLIEDDDYSITYNGALTKNYNSKNIISYFTLNKSDLNDIYNFSLLENVNIHFFDDKKLYTPNKNISKWTVHDAYNCQIPLSYIPFNEIDPNFSATKIMLIDDTTVINKILPKLKENFDNKYTIIRTSPFFVEIFNKETDKGKALKKLTDYLNISKNEIIAIGDNENDLSMIEFAGIGIAMNNAIDILKEKSDYITVSNNENGVAKAIKKFIK